MIGDAPRHETTPYEDAASHYLSPARRDPVKRLWEEPVNHRVVASAVTALDALGDPTRPLRVLDVGAGTGDGLALLTGGLDLLGRPRPFTYLGIDPDPAMVETARRLHGGRGDVAFVRGDVRDPLPDDDVDLFLSAGVPYSHLDHAEFRDAVAALFAGAARRDRPTAIVLDVLGRYSLEWVPCWGEDRWRYDMSFFQGAPVSGNEARAPLAASMSFHSRWSLAEVIGDAERRSGVVVRRLDLHDRSVMVGRHTSTGAFHPGVPDYRGLVNRLHRGDDTVDVADLRLRAPTAGAPERVRGFFADLARSWNDVLAGAGADPAALAEELRALEHRAQQGLGAAHTLIAVVVVTPG